MVDLTDLGAVVGKAVSEKAVSEIEHPNGDSLPQSGSPGLAGLGVVEVLNGGTERGARPEAEFLSQLSSDGRCSFGYPSERRPKPESDPEQFEPFV
jgi:hypothetical protein